MDPARSTAQDTDDGSWALTAAEMRETVAVFDDPDYDDAALFALQDQAIAVVESALGAPVRGKAVVDYYRGSPADGRLGLSIEPMGAEPLGAAQFASLDVVATALMPNGSMVARPLDATLDLSGEAPAVVLAEPCPPLADLANPLRVAYRFAPGPLRPTVVEAIAAAFRSAFDARYRGAPPTPVAQIEAMLGGEGAQLGPYD